MTRRSLRSRRGARFAGTVLLLAGLAGCGLFGGGGGPVRIAAMGPLNAAASPLNGELSAPNAALLEMTAQGLVGYDADGQIDTGLAERWTVTGDGRSYIFRLREAKWSNGREVTADDVVSVLRGYLGANSRNLLKDDFPEIETIRAMTDQVIEIRSRCRSPICSNCSRNLR